MKDREYREGERPENLLRELGYETQDVDYPKVIRSGILLFAFFFGTSAFVLLIIWLGFFPTRLEGGKARPVSERQLPAAPAPLLQSNITVRTDIYDLRRQETKRLEGAGKDAKTGEYHIPVDRAIDALAERGLPKTGATGQSPQPEASR